MGKKRKIGVSFTFISFQNWTDIVLKVELVAGCLS